MYVWDKNEDVDEIIWLKFYINNCKIFNWMKNIFFGIISYLIYFLYVCGFCGLKIEFILLRKSWN